MPKPRCWPSVTLVNHTNGGNTATPTKNAPAMEKVCSFFSTTRATQREAGTHTASVNAATVSVAVIGRFSAANKMKSTATDSRCAVAENTP